jgi:hypothetical protein
MTGSSSGDTTRAPRFARAALVCLLAAAISGCSMTQPWSLNCAFEAPGKTESAEKAEPDRDDRRLGGNPWGAVVLYPLNRVVDLFDVARLGVNVGPGVGLDVQASDLARLAFIYDSSVGAGFQGLRRPPVCVRSRTAMAVGIVRTPPTSTLGWHGQFWDVGAELHALLLGAHAYVNPKEILDFFGGWFFYDPMNDDFETVF